MSRYFHAVGIDFDGTLTQSGKPNDTLLATLSDTRQSGLRLILVTGRILEELRQVFPAANDYFDGIVGENGCVITIGDEKYVLAQPVEAELGLALTKRSVPFRRGQILLASHIEFEGAIREEVRRLGLECQLTRNRSELMVLPSGVSKGTGLVRALDALGISRHNAMGVGDAENDHSLLTICEIGVAVENAVEGLKRHADHVLEQSDGDGVISLLQNIVSENDEAIRRKHRSIRIGEYDDGESAIIPASRINLLITGQSKSGKSFAAGAIVEELIEQEYSVCIIDPEGDYASLDNLHGVEWLCMPEQVLDVGQIRRLLSHSFGSVIVDLSLVNRAEHAKYVDLLLKELTAERKATGLPHWIVVDEAHHALGLAESLTTVCDDPFKGLCLITYQPKMFGKRLADVIDFVLSVPGGRSVDGGDLLADLQQLLRLPEPFPSAYKVRDEALLIDVTDRKVFPRLKLGKRRTIHVRHWHKYVEGELPDRLRFVFRGRDGRGDLIAGNVEEFCDLLRDSPADIVAYHAERADFSSWVRKALLENELAAFVQLIEDRYRNSRRSASDIAALCHGIVRAISHHYGRIELKNRDGGMLPKTGN